MYYFLPKTIQCVSSRKTPEMFKKKITIDYIERLFTLSTNFPTKETCHWWVTRRKQGFIHKNLKIYIKRSRCANISNFRWISQVQMQLAKISQVEIIYFASCEIILQLISSLSYSNYFPFSILQVGKILQIGFHNLRNCCMVDFFCVFPPCILVWFQQRVMKLPSLVFYEFELQLGLP